MKKHKFHRKKGVGDEMKIYGFSPAMEEKLNDTEKKIFDIFRKDGLEYSEVLVVLERTKRRALEEL